MPVIAFSGGMDTCVLLGNAVTKYPDNDLFTITFDYGQPALQRELQAAKDILDFYNLPPTRVVPIPLLPELSVPPLPPGLPTVTELTQDEEEQKAIRRHTFLPFRNFAFMALGSMFCHAVGQRELLFGFILPSGEFPDASAYFVQASNQVLQCTVVDEEPVVVRAPLIGLSKIDVVRLGVRIGAPLHLSYSCFSEGPDHCGTCANCYCRKKAFSEAGLRDEIRYLA